MASLLEAFIADPTPGPSARFSPADVTPAESPLLAKSQREDLLRRSKDAYDPEHGGWDTVNKFIDTESMDLLLAAAEKGDEEAARQARQTLDVAQNLIDRQWGGIYPIFRRSRLEVAALREDHVVPGERAAPIRPGLCSVEETRSISPLLQDLKRFLMTKLRSA